MTTSKVQTPTTTADTADEGSADLPGHIEFARGVRGPAGHTLVVHLLRYRRALRAIRDMDDVADHPLEAVLAMQDHARRALDEPAR